MTPPGAGRDVWADLVGGLLDARSDPATARFDAELTAGLADGSLTEAAAHRLRFWQRASVRLLADHARTVLPVAVGALDAARLEAERYADEAADVLGDADEAAPEPSEAPADAWVPPAAEAPSEPAAEPDLPAPALVVDVSALETSRRASAQEPLRRTTLEERRPRLLVAGLRTAPVVRDQTS